MSLFCKFRPISRPDSDVLAATFYKKLYTLKSVEHQYICVFDTVYLIKQLICVVLTTQRLPFVLHKSPGCRS